MPRIHQPRRSVGHEVEPEHQQDQSERGEQHDPPRAPVRPGDYLECFAEIALLGALSACPGGDCSSEHSSDQAACHPLKVEVFETPAEVLAGWTGPALNG